MFTECKYEKQPNYLKDYLPIDGTDKHLMITINWRELRKAEYAITATAVVTTLHNGLYTYNPANGVCVRVTDKVYGRRTVKELWNAVPIIEAEGILSILKDKALKKELGSI